jgi:MYXO-CTERM domain-containing protein
MSLQNLARLSIASLALAAAAQSKICLASESHQPSSLSMHAIPGVKPSDSAGPIRIALNSNHLTLNAARSMAKANGEDVPAGQPKPWMLLALGAFLIGAISRRRFTSLES